MIKKWSILSGTVVKKFLDGSAKKFVSAPIIFVRSKSVPRPDLIFDESKDMLSWFFDI